MPLVISSSPTEYRFGDTDLGALLFTASGGTGTVDWSTGSGSMSPLTGASSTLTPVNQTEIVTISAQDDLITATKTIQIYATLPVQPKWGIESDVDPPIVRWPMAYEKREFSEYFEMLQFFRWHGKAILEISPAEDDSISVRVVKGRPFYVDDISSGDLTRVYFDSAVRRMFQGINYVDYSFQLMAIDYEIPDTPLTGPFEGEEF